jgi:hypothetical protein
MHQSSLIDYLKKLNNNSFVKYNIVMFFSKIFSVAFNFLSIKKYWRDYFLYNNFVIKFNNIINRLRWKEIELVMIIWPPAYNLFDQIQSGINKEYQVIDYFDFKVDEINFKKFTNSLYHIDFASRNKIENKIIPLQREPMIMRYLLIKIKKPDMQSQDFLNRVKCKNINDLKTKIRKKYMNIIDNYIYDLIIHSTEVDYQNNEVNKLIKKYGKKISDKSNA